MKLPLAGTARRALFLAAGSRIVPIHRRGRLLQRLGLHTHGDVAMGFGVTICNPEALEVGEGSFINNEAYFDAGPVHLGTNVTVGPRAIFVTGNHTIGTSEWRAADGEHSGISVGNGSWIGAGAIILPGVTIGPGCIVGAGAVVISDCEPDGVYAGVPARRIRDLDRDKDLEGGDSR